MNFYLEALQNEHLLLEGVLQSYCIQLKKTAANILFGLNAGAKRLVFCGMGSSYYAALSVIALLNKAGIRAEAYNCYELLHYNLNAIDDRDIVILISQSGNTPEVVSLMEYAVNNAYDTVAMFNNPDCRLRGMSKNEVLLQIGPETPISNKTYYAQVAQLNILSALLVGENVDEVVAEIHKAIVWHGEYITKQKQLTQQLIEELKGVALCDVLGDDAQLGAALQSGLVMREMGKIPACAHSLSDYNHGWFEIASEGYAMIIMADRLSENDQKMIDHCKKNGGRVVLLVPGHSLWSEFEIPNVAASLLPLYTIVPAYFIAGMYRENL